MPAQSNRFTIRTNPFNIPSIFSLDISHSEMTTVITIAFLTEKINTKNFPQTYRILNEHLPSILRSSCFNERQIPFDQEVLQTELGHLFEHILLEYLCIGKVGKGNESAVFNGITQWNWKIEKFGTFHITIDAGKNTMDIFPKALENSIRLLQLILEKEVKEYSYAYKTAQILSL